MLKAFEKNIEYLATAATYFIPKIILKMRFKIWNTHSCTWLPIGQVQRPNNKIYF